MPADTFTFFGKFGDALAMLGNEDRRDLLDAIYLYGSWGEEPELSGPVAAVFAAIREDVDNSKKSRRQGAKGGRPKSRPRGSADAETWGSDTCETGGFADAETGGFQKSETGGSSEPETQTIPSHTKPSHTKPEGEGRARFVPPTVEEVRDHAEEFARSKGRDPGGFDAERFVDFYGSKGWKVGKTPMRDWGRAVNNWVRDEWVKGGSDDDDEYSRLV